MSLFPFHDYWWFYIAFTLFVLVILLIDLGVFNKKSEDMSFKKAAFWTAFWVGLALVFNYAFYQYALWKFPLDPRLMQIPGFEPAMAAKQSALEFLTGFVVEKSLAIDNIFVFIVVFSYFGIPTKYQHRVLFYGILGALFFRAIFIALGSILMQYHFLIIIFGIFLILTGVKMLFAPDKPLDPEKNPLIKLLRKFIKISPKIHGNKLWIKENGVWLATPLFVSLVFIEFTDIIFAIDSVPAIFALTKEPLIVFTSNIFAILGLRSMYFMLAGVMEKFWLLKYGLGFVLIFVGLKMAWLNELYGGKFPISLSLGIILGIISLSILLSFIIKKEKKGVSHA